MLIIVFTDPNSGPHPELDECDLNCNFSAVLYITYSLVHLMSLLKVSAHHLKFRSAETLIIITLRFPQL
jgi:hypothetical protein